MGSDACPLTFPLLTEKGSERANVSGRWWSEPAPGAVAQSSVAKHMVKRRGRPSQGWRTFQMQTSLSVTSTRWCAADIEMPRGDCLGCAKRV